MKARSRSVIVFVLVLVVCALGVAGYAMRVLDKARGDTSKAATPTFTRMEALPAPGGVGQGRPFMLYRSTALGDSYGHVALTYLDSPDGEHGVTPIRCDRVHYASGTGICLDSKRGAMTTYRAVLFDDRLATLKTFDLAGFPSRARVSPDGHKAAFTVFISGHAYSNPGFTTRTSIVDATNGVMLAEDLEAWTVTRDGAIFKATDFNFWGVTFSHKPNQFFATLGTAGQTHLVEGDLETKQLRVIADGVECPSLSPDDTRVAFKHREAVGSQGRSIWHLSVLELATGKVTPLKGEVRNVDDQVEWLDARHILYGMPVDEKQSSAETDVWTIESNSAAAPKLMLPFAFSPAISR
jgi:hypothetical protein